MKVCPICQSTYEDAVDFCFKDGAPLDAQDMGRGEAAEVDNNLAGITADDLEPPDAISLSNIPAVDPDEDAITQTLPVDLPDAEELDRSYDRLEAIEGPPEHDVTGIVDPFGGHEEEKFRALLADDPHDPSLPPEGPPALDGEPGDEDETAGAADVPEADLPVPDDDDDEPEEEPAAAAPPPPPEEPAKPEPAPKPVSKPKAKVTPAPKPPPIKKAAPPPRKGKPHQAVADRRPRKRPEDFGQPQKKDRKGLIIFLVVLVAIVLVIGWQLTQKPSGDGLVADADGTPRPTASVTPVATPEPTPEPVAEQTPEDATPDEDALAEGETPEEIVEPVPEETPAAPAGETDAERRRREERERRRQEREEERRRLEAAQPTPTPAVTPQPTPTSTGAPEPPFNAGGSEPTPRPTVAPSDNPWAATSATPTPAPATDPNNPWGVSQPTTVEVTVSSKPAGARVSIGGRFRGATPVKLSLSPGTHEVRVEQQGFATQTRYLKVEGAGPVGLDVVLEPLVRVASGTLMVASAPPARLYVDGVSKGRTPIAVAITAGTHQFKLETDDGRVLNQSMDIALTEGQTINKFFQIPE